VKQATAQKMGLPEPPTGEREQFCTKCGARVNEWTFLELRGVQVGPDGEVVRPVSQALSPTGGLVVLRGNGRGHPTPGEPLQPA